MVCCQLRREANRQTHQEDRPTNQQPPHRRPSPHPQPGDQEHHRLDRRNQREQPILLPHAHHQPAEQAEQKPNGKWKVKS